MSKSKNNPTIFDLKEVLDNAAEIEYPNLSQTSLGKTLGLDPLAASLDEEIGERLLATSDAIKTTVVKASDEALARRKPDLERYKTLEEKVQGYCSKTEAMQETIATTAAAIKAIPAASCISLYISFWN